MIIDDAEPPPPLSAAMNSASSSSVANIELSASSASGVGRTASASAGERGRGAVVFSPRRLSQFLWKMKNNLDQIDEYKYCATTSNVQRSVTFDFNPSLCPSVTSIDSLSASFLLDVDSITASNGPRRSVEFDLNAYFHPSVASFCT